jgi:hypothetical protein
MAPLHSFFASRSADSVAPGADGELPPGRTLRVDAPDAPTATALAAAKRGDFGPARDLLAGTRECAEWDRRDDCVRKLAEGALHTPQWLNTWHAELPGDPDAWLVSADLGVVRAWHFRSDLTAKHVTSEQFRLFGRELADALPTIQQAAALNPEDPVPWRIALTHARGTGAPRGVFGSCLQEFLDRDPGNYPCHTNALQYLCAKWYGSHEEMFEFAEYAADHAEPGALLNALPVCAVTEYQAPVGRGQGGSIAPERLTAAVDRALEASAHHPPGDRAAAGFRNHLALALVRAGRHAEALEQFRAIGTDVRSTPWGYLGSAIDEFIGARRKARTGARLRGRSRP